MATEAEIEKWLKGYKRDWSGLCQALAWQMCNKFGHAPTSYDSAIIAAHHSKIESKDYMKSPPGSFHYWSMGQYGHVAIGLGGDRCIMASQHVDEQWSFHAGPTTISKYNRVMPGAKATYLGWSRTNGDNDLTIVGKESPKAPAQKLMPNERIAKETLNAREKPSTKAKIVGQLPGGHIGTFDGWINGEAVGGNDVWFRGNSGHFFHSGGFEDKSTHNLVHIVPPKPEPAPAPVVKKPDPVKVIDLPDKRPITDAENTPVPTDGYHFTKDVPCVTEVIPAPESNWDQDKLFPDKPQKVVIHQFGNPGVDTLGSTINWFTNPESETSAHFVVSGKHIIQMVSLGDRAWHAGPKGNDFVGIETDPKQDEDTIDSVHILLEELRDHYGYVLEPIKHSSVAATSCGSFIDLKNYQIAPIAAKPEPTPKPVATPAPEPKPAPPVEAPTPSKDELIEQAVADLQANLGALLKLLKTE
jgi:hypothetical protein